MSDLGQFKLAIKKKRERKREMFRLGTVGIWQVKAFFNHSSLKYSI